MILAFTLLELEDVESFNSKRVLKLAGPIRLDDRKPWRGPFGAVGVVSSIHVSTFFSWRADVHFYPQKIEQW